MNTLSKPSKSSDVKTTKKNGSGINNQDRWKLDYKTKYKVAAVKYDSTVAMTNRSKAVTPGYKEGTIDDANTSEKISIMNLTDDMIHQRATKTYLTLDSYMSNYSKELYHGVNLRSTNELDLFNKTYRFGYYNFDTLSAGREFLFFTKPDLHILNKSGKGLKALEGSAFWQDLIHYRPEIIYSLQMSAKGGNKSDYFNHLLQNQCTSNLDIPGLSAGMIETPVNDYGVGYGYRGSSEASDDNPEFSLEFKDDRWLTTYNYFKAYEIYETMKHHGQIAPKSSYTVNRIIHDCFAIYKFIVAEDMETIVYWGKMYGVVPKSLPRDAFSNANFDSGITFSVDFSAAFYEDMIPDILTDFNALSLPYYNTLPYKVEIYNNVLGTADTRPGKAAIVKLYKSVSSPSGYVYKLKWKGDDVV